MRSQVECVGSLLENVRLVADKEDKSSERSSIIAKANAQLSEVSETPESTGKSHLMTLCGAGGSAAQAADCGLERLNGSQDGRLYYQARDMLSSCSQGRPTSHLVSFAAYPLPDNKVCGCVTVCMCRVSVDYMLGH